MNSLRSNESFTLPEIGSCYFVIPPPVVIGAVKLWSLFKISGVLHMTTFGFLPPFVCGPWSSIFMVSFFLLDSWGWGSNYCLIFTELRSEVDWHSSSLLGQFMLLLLIICWIIMISSDLGSKRPPSTAWSLLYPLYFPRTFWTSNFISDCVIFFFFFIPDPLFSDYFCSSKSS